MTNEEIIEQIDKGESWEYMNTAMVTHIGNLPAALELARQDEREKMKGVELTPDEIEMIKNCLPYGVTNLKYCIKSNLDLYNKYLTWERILPNLLTKLTTEAT